jgi:hypothetical protein
MEIDTRKEDYKNRVRSLLQGWMDNNSESIKSWSEGDATLDFSDLVLNVDDLEVFDYFVGKMYDKKWHAHDAYMFFRWSEDVDPRVPEDVGIRKMKEIEDRNNANQPVGLSENKRNKVKITKTHLKQLIKEERAKLLSEMNSGHPQGVGSPHRAHELGAAFGALHSAIDSLINLIGREETLSELEGMVYNWQEESYPEQVQQQSHRDQQDTSDEDVGEEQSDWYDYQLENPIN